MFYLEGRRQDGSRIPPNEVAALFATILARPDDSIRLMQNFGTLDGGKEVGADQLRKDGERMFRFWAARRGQLVLSSGDEEKAEEFVRYLSEVGLSTPSDAGNPLYVDAPLNDTEAVLDEISRSSTLTVEPYYLNEELLHLASRLDLPLVAPDPSALAAVEDMNDKGAFKNFIDALYAEARSESFFQYPRALVEPPETNPPGAEWIGAATTSLEACIAYARRYEPRLPFMLYIQDTLGSGGLGNYRVDWDWMLDPPSGDRIPLHDLTGLVQWLSEQSFRSEITPFLELESSFSFGCAADPERIWWWGPRIQIEERGAYQGFRIDHAAPSPEDEAMYREARFIAEAVARRFQERRYYAPFAIDLFIFWAPDGARTLSLSELNRRLDGTAGALGLWALHPHWRRALTDGSVSLEYLSEVRLDTPPSTLDAARLVQQSVPLTSREEPYGATLLTPAFRTSDGATSVGLMISAPSDAERQIAIEQIRELTAKE